MARIRIDQLNARMQAQVAQQIEHQFGVFGTCLVEITDTHIEVKAPNAKLRYDHRSPQGSIAEQIAGDAHMESATGETLYAGRVSVCIKSYRRRLLDPDNLIGKYFLDACRYSRIIRGDRPEDIQFQVSQEKVASKDQERTEITITPIYHENILH